MDTTFFALNHLIGTAILLLQIALIGLIGLYFYRAPKLEAWVVRLAIPLGLLFSATGIVVSLIYSEYFGIVPCGLCWLGRVFLYPQAILFAIAAWRRDASVALYSIALSIFGAFIALYQHYLQMGGSDVLPCPASGVSDCAKRFLFEYNYITFPLVGFTVFVTIIVLMLFLWRAHRHTTTA